MLENLILIVHVLVAMAMIGLILLQQGKGAEMGASFGSGSSQTVFGAAGSASFLTKVTWWLAAIFFTTSLTLAIFAHQRVQASGSVVPGLDVAPVAASGKAGGDVPAAPAAPAGALKTVQAAGDIPVAPATQPATTPGVAAAQAPIKITTVASPSVAAPVVAGAAAPAIKVTPAAPANASGK